MTIAVVIPAYNEEKFIGRCLEGLMQQTTKPDNIIVVDNNCSDKTIHIVQTFPSTRIIHEPTQGISFARNRGFDSANADIIARCDADTIPSPNWIAKIKKHFENHSIDGITGPYSFYDTKHRRAIDKLHVSTAYFRMNKVIMGHYPFLGGNMAIRNAAWRKIRTQVCMDNDKVHEDIDLAIHLFHAGGVIIYDPSLIMPSSARRLKYPLPSLVKYLAKWPGTKLYHNRK